MDMNCFLITLKEENVHFLFHFSLREEQWNNVVLEDLLENIEMDTFLALYNQVRV